MPSAQRQTSQSALGPKCAATDTTRKELKTTGSRLRQRFPIVAPCPDPVQPPHTRSIRLIAGHRSRERTRPRPRHLADGTRRERRDLQPHSSLPIHCRKDEIAALRAIAHPAP